MILDGFQEPEWITIYNSLGKVVHQSWMDDEVKQFHLKQLPSGVYYISLARDKEVQSVKFIITNP